MTKDKKIYFRFKSERQQSMIFAYIRELKQKELRLCDITAKVKREFNINPHEKTIEGWAKKQSCRFSPNWQRDEAYMKKCRAECEKSKQFLSKDELILETMYDQAKSEGIIE